MSVADYERAKVDAFLGINNIKYNFYRFSIQILFEHGLPSTFVRFVWEVAWSTPAGMRFATIG